MRKVITIILILITLSVFSQTEYPKLSKDSSGNKIVLLTIDQAQRVDNNLEILNLLTIEDRDCDSLNHAYIKVINELNKQIFLLKKENTLIKSEIDYKSGQIKDLIKEKNNLVKSDSLCSVELNNNKQIIKDKDIEIKKLNKQKWSGWFVAGALGILEVLTIIHFQ